MSCVVLVSYSTACQISPSNRAAGGHSCRLSSQVITDASSDSSEYSSIHRIQVVFLGEPAGVSWSLIQIGS